MLATASEAIRKGTKRYVEKYGALTRLLHFIHLISFIVLAITGLSLAYKWNGLGEFLFGSMKNVKSVHEFFGWVLTISGGLLFLKLLPESTFKPYDFKWFAKLGGYLDPTHKTHAPAGRVNAGQKIFYWFGLIALIVMAVTGFSLMYDLVSKDLRALFLVVHFVVGVLWISFVIIHFYLATIANPGTIWAMINGKVSEDYIKVHNPEWYKELKEKGIL